GMGLCAPDGWLLADSWHLTGPTFELKNPATKGWMKSAARALDRGFNALVGAEHLDEYVEPARDRLDRWPEARQARAQKKAVTVVRNAPDLTPVISAAVPVNGGVLMATTNDRAFTRTVRSQRANILAAMVFLIGLSV